MKCAWTKRALREYRNVLTYIAKEFGKKTALDFVDGVEFYDDRLSRFPEMGAPEPFLSDRTKYVYHSLIVSKYNKVIYIIDSERKVTVVDMWDMRREPNKLLSRIKSK